MSLREDLRWWWFDCWLRRRWNSAYNWVMNRFWRRWNRVHIKTLNEQWHDRDEVLLHAMFQILVDFVEGEEPRVLVDDPHWYDHATCPEEIVALKRQEDSNKEIRALYKWWTEVYPNRKDPLDEYDGPDWCDMIGNEEKRKAFDNSEAGKKWDEVCKLHRKTEEEWHAEETDMMTRLIKIRGCLWT
jgi:hypothetical protein